MPLCYLIERIIVSVVFCGSRLFYSKIKTGVGGNSVMCRDTLLIFFSGLSFRSSTRCCVYSLCEAEYCLYFTNAVCFMHDFGLDT